jgi:hypothetical protein
MNDGGLGGDGGGGCEIATTVHHRCRRLFIVCSMIHRRIKRIDDERIEKRIEERRRMSAVY